jgi:DNA primase
MSIYQCGGVAVPLCGTQNVGKFLSFFANHLFKGVLVLAFDNDNAGKVATDKIIGGTQKNVGLADLGIHYVIKNVASECKDPNELLVKDSQRLKNNIEKTIKEIEEINENVWNEHTIE